MNVAERIKSWKKIRRLETTALREKISLMEELAETLEALPDGVSYSSLNPSGDKVVLTGIGSDDAEVREILRGVREVLGVRESTKELNSSAGTITYVTENDHVIVRVGGGAVPANCKLIPESQSYSYITYRMECSEN